MENLYTFLEGELVKFWFGLKLQFIDLFRKYLKISWLFLDICSVLVIISQVSEFF